MQSVRIQITVASAEAVIIANCITSNQEQCIQQQKQLWAGIQVSRKCNCISALEGFICFVLRLVRENYQNYYLPKNRHRLRVFFPTEQRLLSKIDSWTNVDMSWLDHKLGELGFVIGLIQLVGSHNLFSKFFLYLAE